MVQLINGITQLQVLQKSDNKINMVQVVDDIDKLQVSRKFDHECRRYGVNKNCKFSSINGYFSLTKVFL